MQSRSFLPISVRDVIKQFDVSGGMERDVERILVKWNAFNTCRMGFAFITMGFMMIALCVRVLIGVVAKVMYARKLLNFEGPFLATSCPQKRVKTNCFSCRSDAYTKTIDGRRVLLWVL